MMIIRRARDYLVPPLFSFWKWSQDGTVLCWRDGTTIAFRQELDAIVEKLAATGLPPLSSIALILGACQAEDWRQFGLKDLHKFLTNLTGNPDPDSLPALTFGLETIRCLRPQLRGSLNAKIQLCQLIFESDPGKYSREESYPIIDSLGDLGAPTIQHTAMLAPAIANYERLKQSVLFLADELQFLDVDQIELRSKTGLDSIPDKSEEVPLPKIFRGLLKELEDDDDFGGIARLARRALVAATLPRPASIPDETTLGGISDISNRGRLDRLLPTELAHDDLVLAARIANNEALYWLQEIQPKPPSRGRLIVLDGGIRLWGRARRFALAVTLAYALRSEPKSPLFVQKILKDRIIPIRMDSKTELLELLGFLDCSIHPGSALKSILYFKTEECEDFDRILVTSSQSFSDPEFMHSYQNAKRVGKDNTLFVATVNETGNFELWSLGQRGRKRWRKSILPIEDIAPKNNNKRPGRPLYDEIHDPALPEILYQRPFPIRLPQPRLKYTDVRSSPTYNSVSVTKDGRLLHWDSARFGGLQVTDQLPSGQKCFFSINNNGLVILVLLHANNLYFVYAQLGQFDCQIVETKFDRKNLRGVAYHRGGFFLIHNDRSIGVYNSYSGQLLETVQFPSHLDWSHRRFFRDTEKKWWALSFNGQSAALEMVPNATEDWWLFDRDGLDGPWALVNQGFIACTVDGRMTALPHVIKRPVSLVNLAPEGHKVILRGIRDSSESIRGKNYLYNLKTKEHVALDKNSNELLLPTSNPWSEHTLTHFTSISISQNQEIILHARKRSFCVRLDHESGELRLTTITGFTDRLKHRSFSKNPFPYKNRRYALRRLHWRDGSEAFLDSRGMLHLISSEPRSPQITLILSESHLSIWLSDRRVYGSNYFFGPSQIHRKLRPDEVQSILIEFARRLI
ncbi:MAG: hypothetical protein P1V97_07925 [Planctomycetota bacterium]|nr:hypothetical protein [Planctomycetota bacterium]